MGISVLVLFSRLLIIMYGGEEGEGGFSPPHGDTEYRTGQHEVPEELAHISQPCQPMFTLVWESHLDARWPLR